MQMGGGGTHQVAFGTDRPNVLRTVDGVWVEGWAFRRFVFSRSFTVFHPWAHCLHKLVFQKRLVGLFLPALMTFTNKERPDR